MNQILIHQLKIYPIDYCDEKELITHLMVSLARDRKSDSQENIPFAVMGSQTQVVVDGRTVRGRKYRWGIVEGNLSVPQC